jgi:hypothetical protein
MAACAASLNDQKLSFVVLLKSSRCFFFPVGWCVAAMVRWFVGGRFPPSILSPPIEIRGSHSKFSTYSFIYWHFNFDLYSFDF